MMVAHMDYEERLTQAKGLRALGYLLFFITLVLGILAIWLDGPNHRFALTSGLFAVFGGFVLISASIIRKDAILDEKIAHSMDWPLDDEDDFVEDDKTAYDDRGRL